MAKNRTPIEEEDDEEGDIEIDGDCATRRSDDPDIIDERNKRHMKLMQNRFQEMNSNIDESLNAVVRQHDSRDPTCVLSRIVLPNDEEVMFGS